MENCSDGKARKRKHAFYKKTNGMLFRYKIKTGIIYYLFSFLNFNGETP